MKKIDEESIQTLRFLSIDEIQAANSGHPGLPLGTAPLMYTLWDRFMHYNPENPAWFNRDRFILSPGHGSALLYAMLHLAGYGVSLDDLKQFRQWGSLTPGHPEYGLTPGVDLSTGPLGHGFAMGVGMAMAEAMLAARYNKKGYPVVDHYTYGITSDGDQMEGVASEAASLAGTLGLGKLIFLYDDNHITIEGDTKGAFREDVGARFEAYGWQVLRVSTSEDVDELAKAIEEAKKDTKHPSLIIVPTHIGFGSPRQDMAKAHGEPLGVDNVAATKKAAGWNPERSFYVPAKVKKHFESKLTACRKAEADWNKLMKGYAAAYPDLAAELNDRLSGKIELNLKELMKAFDGVDSVATRGASGTLLQVLADKIPALTGGSADLGPSNKTVLKNSTFFSAEDRLGRNIHFGIREHAMGCIVNGMALHGGFVPYGATFLVFADFMRPAIRMAALMGIGSKFVFTHDSIFVGEDGPTHQPIEQTMSLRLIPNVSVIRPADALETAAAWKIACETTNKPTCLLLTRQGLPVLHDYAKVIAKGVEKGAYILSPSPKEKMKAVIIATGSEVHLALEAQKALAARRIGVQVVSMPSWDLFEAQSAAYKRRVLPKGVPCIAIEAGVKMGWSRYTGSDSRVLGIERFGASAPGKKVYAEFGFTVEHVVDMVRKLK
ncbi:MAG: transketolase [Acidaminococcus sp.]|jgi:transketolase|nr:transketolase [Acidaminococcus sp.]MCI2099937.1 transketolase [Acidaminococcus sp.]MCI2114168.1 transketolase [Acidaminococcus sp.]MCI2116348.1 transketolase [Acidaminococcus sp.]